MRLRSPEKSKGRYGSGTNSAYPKMRLSPLIVNNSNEEAPSAKVELYQLFPN